MNEYSFSTTDEALTANFSWPAVSHISSLRVLPSTWSVCVKKAAPTVGSEFSTNCPRTNRSTKDDLPTDDSPSNTTCVCVFVCLCGCGCVGCVNFVCVCVMRANEFVSIKDCAPPHKIQLALGVGWRCPGNFFCLINTDKLMSGDVQLTGSSP